MQIIFRDAVAIQNNAPLMGSSHETAQQIASSQSQENEFILDKAIKSCTTHLTVYLFGEFFQFVILII